MQVTIQVTLDDSMAAELRVFLGKVQCANERAACDHPRLVHILNTLPKQIDSAASYQRQINEGLQRSVEAKAGGAQ